MHTHGGLTGTLTPASLPLRCQTEQRRNAQLHAVVLILTAGRPSDVSKWILSLLLMYVQAHIKHGTKWLNHCFFLSFFLSLFFSLSCLPLFNLQINTSSQLVNKGIFFFKSIFFLSLCSIFPFLIQTENIVCPFMFN